MNTLKQEIQRQVDRLNHQKLMIQTNWTRSKFKFHNLITSPITLGLAFGCGFLAVSKPLLAKTVIKHPQVKKISTHLIKNVLFFFKIFGKSSFFLNLLRSALK